MVNYVLERRSAPSSPNQPGTRQDRSFLGFYSPGGRLERHPPNAWKLLIQELELIVNIFTYIMRLHSHNEEFQTQMSGMPSSDVLGAGFGNQPPVLADLCSQRGVTEPQSLVSRESFPSARHR